jgi:hypothetical protein
MEGLFVPIVIVLAVALLDALAAAFGAESREPFVDPASRPIN